MPLDKATKLEGENDPQAIQDGFAVEEAEYPYYQNGSQLACSRQHSPGEACLRFVDQWA